VFLRYNTATEIDFFMPDNADPWSGKTGLTSITVQYKKQGQSAFTTLSSPTISEIGNGWYKLSVPTTLVDTYGFLVIRFSATGAKTQQQQYQVVAFNPYDSNMGLANLDAAVSSRLPNGNVTVGGYASGMSPAEQVLSTPANKLLTNSNGHVTVATNNDKSGYSLQTSEHTAIASSVWSATTRTLSSLGNSLVDEIWHRLRSASDPPAGSFGYYLDAQVSSVGGGAGGTSDWTTAEKEQIRYVLGIDGAKTAPTGNTGWIPDIRSKTQQLTFTGFNVNANVSSYSNGLSPGEQVLATPSLKIVTDSGGNVSISSTQADSISSTAASLVWSAAVTSLTGANTIGKRIVDYLDTTVSSRSTLTVSDVQTALTNQGYTTARASRLDNLDATVSSRLATSAFSPTGIAEAVWNTPRGASRTYDTFGFYLDARISGIAGGGGGGFYGPYDVALQFLDDNSNPVSGVVFFVEGIGGAVAPGGSITINLPGGNFIVRAMGAGSVLFSPTAISVTGSGSFQIRGARVSVPVSTSRNSVVLHYLLSDDRGNPLPNTDLTVTILDLPVGADRSIWNVGQTWTVRSNSNGIAVLPELPVSALVELTATVGTRPIRVTLRVPRMEQ